MQPKTSSVAVIIFIGCSASSMAWPLDNKPLATENTSHENLTETLRGRQRDIDTASFFPADERWLKVDEQRWSHLVKRAEPEPAQREREARKRPYIPLNSLTFMTANNEVAPIDWYSQNDTDIRQQIAASKLAGYRKPSDQKTSTSTSLYKPENSTSTDVTPNKFLLFYTTTKKSLPQHDIFPEPSKHPTTHITPSTGIYSSTFREPSLATPSPPKSNSFLSGSKLITFIPVLVSTTPPPYRISTPTSSSNASGLQSTLESLHQHLTNSSRTPSFEYTTKRSAILTLMDKVMANPSAADTTTELHSTTSAYPLTSTKLPPHEQTEEIVTWPSSKAPNITDGYFTAQYFLEANFPKRNSSHFGDKNTTGLEITYKKPSVNHQVQRPNFSDINRLGNSSVSSFSNSTTTPTSAPLTIVDQLVLHEAFNRLKNQEELLSPLQNANSTLPTVYSQQVTFIEEPSVVGLSESAQTAVTEKDEDWSLGYTKITETEPTTDWVTSPEPSSTPEPPEISTSISSGTSSPYYVQVTPLATKIAASPIYYSHSLLLPNQSGTSETKTAQQQPLPQKADGNDSIKPAVDLTTVPSQPAGDTTVSDYEYDFFEDDLNSGAISSHPNPDNINPMNLSRSNTEHYSDVMVRVWEMEGGQLNLVNEQPVPIEMFQNTSLTNGAVVNPQDVPTKVMAMVSSTAQVNHPLLNPESYLHTRRRRSSQNFTDDDPNDILNLKSSSTTMEHPKDNVSSYTNHSVNSLTENEPTLFNDRLEEFHDHQEYMPHNSSSNINSNVSLLHTIMPHLVGHLSSSYHTFLQRLGQNPEATQSQTNENNLFTIAATAGRNMDGNVPNVHHFNAATHFKKQSENHFGGVGNPDHSNLPLAIGTALQESDINYLQTLYKFANLLADSSNTQPTIQSYLKTLSQSPGPNQTPSRLPLTKHDLNNDSNLKPDVEELAAAQRTDAHQSQENSNSQYGSVLEFLPPELPHINPLLASNEASGYNPVDLGKVITSLPSSSTLIREQLKSTLAAVTGTNTFSGHLGNQGYVSHNSHATQNSISGNNEQAYIPQESQHSEEGISSFLGQRHFQSSVPTSIDEAYYPYAHQTESNPSNDHEFSLLNLLQGSTFQGQQRPNIQDATFTNFHDVPSQTQFQNLGQQDSLLNSAFVNQIEQQRPSAMAELGLQQPFLANSNTDSHNKLPGALLSDAALFSSNNLLGISNYPTPLLDFIFQNMSANNFQPQEIGLRIPQIQASEPVGSFNPTDPYIPALDSSILGEPNVANPTNLLPESSASITPVRATFTSGSGSSVANCQKNAGCILGLAGLASLGISKALLLPFFLGRRRRRRHSPNLTSHIENLKAAADFHPLFPNSINQDSFTKDTLMDDITKINNSSINAPQDNDQPDILVKLLASKRNMPKEREPLEDLFYRLPENLQLTFMTYTLEVLSQREKTHSTAKE